MNTNSIGNVTEIECILAFTKLGYQVSLPFGGQARYDFLIDVQGEILKIQVKTCTPQEDGNCIKIDCRNSQYKKGHYTHTKYKNEEIDFFATFYNGKCYLIPVEECSVGKRLRFAPCKNGQIKEINFAKDYELEMVINKYFSIAN